MNRMTQELELDGLDQLEATPAILRGLMCDLSVEDTEWKPGPDRFSVAEVLAHLSQAIALVHEVFLRLVEVDSVTWQDRAHFFAVSANMMRRGLGFETEEQLLVCHARWCAGGA
jgi:hypothetical protein